MMVKAFLCTIPVIQAKIVQRVVKSIEIVFIFAWATDIRIKR